MSAVYKSVLTEWLRKEKGEEKDPLARFSNLVTMVIDTHGMAGVGKENWCKIRTNRMLEWRAMDITLMRITVVCKSLIVLRRRIHNWFVTVCLWVQVDATSLFMKCHFTWCHSHSGTFLIVHNDLKLVVQATSSTTAPLCDPACGIIKTRRNCLTN